MKAFIELTTFDGMRVIIAVDSIRNVFELKDGGCDIYYRNLTAATSENMPYPAAGSTVKESYDEIKTKIINAGML